MGQLQTNYGPSMGYSWDNSLPSRHRLHGDLDSPCGLLGLLPGVAVARPLVLVDEQAHLVGPGDEDGN